MSWTHAICVKCWELKNPGSNATTIANKEVEICCYCGEPTASGIYVRDDPDKLKCRHSKEAT